MYIVVTIGCLFVLAALAAWKVVPLLLARPTITVDYLSRANEATKPPNYDPNLNAAPCYERLFSEFIPLPELLDRRSWPGDLRPDEYKALEEWVPANQVVLSALADAARCPYWWSEMKPEDGALSSVGVSHAVESRKCTFGVLLLAKYEASQGNVEQGVRLLADLHMMGVHRIRAGTLAEQLTGLAVCKVVHDAVFAILDHCQIDADLLAWTLDVFASRASRIVVPQFLEVEYLYGLDSIQRHFTDDGAGDGRLIPARLYESRKKLSLLRRPLAYPEALRICLAHPGRRRTTRLFEAYFELARGLARKTPLDLYTQDTSYEKELKRFMSGNFFLQDESTLIARCMELGCRDHLGAEALVAVLAILTHKAREGRLPESLAEAVDAGLLEHLPMDPYNSGPLIYRRAGDDFTLYSVGEDFVDDGGIHCEWNDEDGGDCVFWPVPKTADLRSEE